MTAARNQAGYLHVAAHFPEAIAYTDHACQRWGGVGGVGDAGAMSVVNQVGAMQGSWLLVLDRAEWLGLE